MANRLNYRKYDETITHTRSGVVFRGRGNIWGFIKVNRDYKCNFYMQEDDGTLLKSVKTYPQNYYEDFDWWYLHTINDPFIAVQEKIPTGKVEDIRVYHNYMYFSYDIEQGLYATYQGGTSNEKIKISSLAEVKVAHDYKAGKYWTGRPNINDDDEVFYLQLDGINSNKLLNLFEFVDEINEQISIPGWTDITSPMKYHSQ